MTCRSTLPQSFLSFFQIRHLPRRRQTRLAASEPNSLLCIHTFAKMTSNGSQQEPIPIDESDHEGEEVSSSQLSNASQTVNNSEAADDSDASDEPEIVEVRVTGPIVVVSLAVTSISYVSHKLLA
jgi:hypothetical protein